MIQILLRLVIIGDDTHKPDGTRYLRFEGEVSEEGDFSF